MIFKSVMIEVNFHEAQARDYSRLASDNLAVAMAEETNLERKKEYLGYAEDYSLYAQKELTKAYRILSNELHEANVNKSK